MRERLIQLLIKRVYSKCARRTGDDLSCPEAGTKYEEWCVGCLAYEINNIPIKKECDEQEGNRGPLIWGWDYELNN